VTAISAGYVADLAVTSDGKVVAWGQNYYGQLDIPASLDTRTVTSVSAGLMHNLALTSDGKVIAWGYDGSGQTDVPASLDDR
jgi:alpha-tubulin suppressor-like RCC1 family protein